MEQLLGKTVMKPLPDHDGLFSGIVSHYDSSSDSYLILYDTGASEHLSSSNLAALLDSEGDGHGGAVPIQVKPRRRGRPRKQQQRGNVDLGNVDGEGRESGACEGRFGDDFESAAAVRSVDGVVDGKGQDDSVWEVEEKKFGFDLNLVAKESFDDQMVGSRAGFDLNLGCEPEQVIDDIAVDTAQNHDITVDGSLDGDGEEANSKKPKIRSCNGTVDDFGSGLLEVGEQDCYIREVHTRSPVTVSNASDICSPGDQMKKVPSHDVTPVSIYQSDDSGGYQSGTRGRRKRRQTLETERPTSERVLRRSARRSGTFSSSSVASVYMFDSTDQNCGKRKATSFLDAVDMSSSDLTRNLTNQESPCEDIEDFNPSPTKLRLPASSQDLNLNGKSVLNLFSVYSFIRSFSTVLFLSPFELEDFCAALKCKSPTSLFDQTHVSLLQTLRKHLQFLSAEGSKSASDCLRSLNWDSLDSVSWPLFINEYLLLMKPDFDMRQLNLVDTDYYQQPESLKVDILSILCDDLVDTECIRAEINRRSLIDELELDPRIKNTKDSKRRKANMGFLSGSSSTSGELMDQINDWNSDECCLCKVDGSLICCDGCPAAYHSRCVGVASDLLPDGDWYCPECNIDRNKAWKKHRSPLRGADSLGVDPDGRIYFGTCECLLVFDSHEDNAAISYYCRNDLFAVIEVLKSSDIRYGAILNAISQHWGISIHPTETMTDQSLRNRNVLMSKEDFCESHLLLGSSEFLPDSIVNGQNEDGFPNVTYNRDLVKSVYRITSFEGSAEVSHSQTASELQNSENIARDRPAEVSNVKPELPENPASIGVPIMNDCSHMKVEENLDSSAHAHLSGMRTSDIRSSSEEHEVIYSNRYRLAQVASSVAEDLFGKCSDKTNKIVMKPNEESFSSQLKAIVKKCSRFCWSSIRKLDAQTENCGWCYCCKAPEVDTDCLFKLNYSWPPSKDLESWAIDHPSKGCGKGHLVDIISYVLFIESRLQGLLMGPWLNPQHSANWSRSFLKSFDLASVKYALLMLESNLHHLAFSAEWSNFVDSTHTLGSASYVVTSSTCLGLKHGVSRKRGRSLLGDSELLPTPNAATDLDFFWWRGGRTSRRVFCWKILPRPLAVKAARQAGRNMIPGIHYPEASELAKRRRNIAWRAAVENSSSVEQLAYLIRELDSNIRWDDIENTNPFTKIDKKLARASRLFKKVIIRRKKVEGTVVKYLLDFGKRRTIPDIVVTHGAMFEESASERKKYWLEESLVPVHLLKLFEDNRICRKNYKMKSGKLFDSMFKKKSSRPRDFSYLFSRAKKLETFECGHCKKSVSIRESVRCQFCEGYFHKRHVRRSKEKDLAGDKYSCNKCHQDNLTKVETEKDIVRTLRIKKVSVAPKSVPQGKIRVCSRVGVAVKSQTNKAVMQIPLRRSSRKIKFKYVPIKKKRRSPRKSKFVPVSNQKAVGRKRGRPAKTNKSAPKNVKDAIPRRKKMRTQVHHSYWLNGLKLTKNPDDELVVKFRKEKLLVPSEDLNIILSQPVCKICSLFTSELIYICCEVCEDWFHGRAFGVDSDNADYIIGFRCHSCRKREPPVCPVLLETKSHGTESVSKNKCRLGEGDSPSLNQLNGDGASLQDCRQSGQIGEVVSGEGKSVMQNPDQNNHSEVFLGTEIDHRADDTDVDMEGELQTETSEHSKEKECLSLRKVHNLSLDATGAAGTSFGTLEHCNGVTETEASNALESSATHNGT